MSETISNPQPYPAIQDLRPLLAPYARANQWKAIGQLANTLIPFFLLWYLMLRSLEISYLLTLALGVIAAGLNVRAFIFFHDCGHNSFLPSTRANRIVGSLLGFLSLTPGDQWWKAHAIHHATNGNLDRRGVGDVLTLTVDEYRGRSRWQKLTYWVMRNPVFMLVFGPIVIFVLGNRIPDRRFGKREMLSAIYMDIALIVIITGMCLLVGWKAFLLVQLPITWISGAWGIWLFYIQHQFEGAYWERSENWDYVTAALSGASCYKMPGILEWFSGNIGYHHIHHLSPRIPNYQLRRCYRDQEALRKYGATIPFGQGYKSMNLALWDEKTHRMVSFSEALRGDPMAQANNQKSIPS